MKKKKPGSFNFKKEIEPYFGCRACAHCIMGVCVLAQREVPLTYALHNSTPKWCPKGGEK